MNPKSHITRFEWGFLASAHEMNPKSHQFQLFVQSPDLQIPIQTLTLDPDLTLLQLKSSLLQNSQITHDSFFFTFNGKPLPDSSTLRNPQITPHSTLTLRPRLLGGGGDGGATGAESRDCYLNMYAVKKPDKVDPNEQRLSKWLNCALSNEPLKHPIVVDYLGNVFNKQALVEAMLGKKLPRAFGHIRGLKDMIPISLDRFQCPITDLEFNGKYKFFALKNCGHVLSAKALKEVKSSGCLVCHKEFGELDKIVINGSDEEVAVLRKRMEEEKANLKEKKIKKVSGTKHGLDGKVVHGHGHGKANGGVKKFKAIDVAPANATKEVYASIFTSSRKSDFKETYSCRSLPLGRN